MGNRASAKAKNYQQGKRQVFLAPKTVAVSVSSRHDARLGATAGSANVWEDVADAIRDKVHQRYVETNYAEALEASKEGDK